MFGCAPVSADERNQAPQLSSSRRREAGRRQRVSGGKSAVPVELMQELAEAYLWRVGGSKLQLE